MVDRNGKLEHITFLSYDSHGYLLEGVLHLPEGAGPWPGVIICHPDPRGGGQMDNPLLIHIAEALSARGMAALRFNFAGVGASKGPMARGEGETLDVAGAVGYLFRQPEILPGRLYLVGWSRGARFGLSYAARDQRVGAIVAIGLPTSGDLPAFASGDVRPKLFITGEYDHVCRPEALQAWMDTLSGDNEARILPGTDHFLGGREREVARMTSEFLVQAAQRVVGERTKIVLDSDGVPLAATFHTPDSDAWPPPYPAVIIGPGFGSRKENHADFASLLTEHGFTALVLDWRGHGESRGRLDGDTLNDVGAAIAFLSQRPEVDAERLAMRGSSMGGYYAIHAGATYPQFRAVVAICAGPEELLLRDITTGRLDEALREHTLNVRLDKSSFVESLRQRDIYAAAAAISPRAVFFIHAKGDEIVPYTYSRQLYAAAREPKRLLVLEDGSHTSAQHDPAVQLAVIEWLRELWNMPGKNPKRTATEGTYGTGQAAP